MLNITTIGILFVLKKDPSKINQNNREGFSILQSNPSEQHYSSL